MKVFSDEKIKVLAEKNGWSLTLAKGYVDGQTFRRRREAPSKYAQVGIDEYCLGFRAGYYNRELAGTKPLDASAAPAVQPIDNTGSQ